MIYLLIYIFFCGINSIVPKKITAKQFWNNKHTDCNH